MVGERDTFFLVVISLASVSRVTEGGRQDNG